MKLFKDLDINPEADDIRDFFNVDKDVANRIIDYFEIAAFRLKKLSDVGTPYEILKTTREEFERGEDREMTLAEESLTWYYLIQAGGEVRREDESSSRAKKNLHDNVDKALSTSHAGDLIDLDTDIEELGEEMRGIMNTEFLAHESNNEDGISL